MIDSDKRKFLEAITGCAAIYRVEIKTPQISMYWELLKEFETADVMAAVQRHLKTSKFFPSPAELIEYIPASRATRHVGADEAWAIVIESFDEESTVVMTSEIAEARGISLPIYQAGDEIGARVAFRDAYNRITKTAQSPQWFVSEGFDKARRADAVAKAVQLGRLPDGSDGKYRLEAQRSTIAGLLASAESRDGSAGSVFAIGRIRAMLAGIQGDDGIQRRAAERERFEMHRKAELTRLEEKRKGIH